MPGRHLNLTCSCLASDQAERQGSWPSYLSHGWLPISICLVKRFMLRGGKPSLRVLYTTVLNAFTSRSRAHISLDFFHPAKLVSSQLLRLRGR